jgi:hypothetical protein
VTHFFRHPVSSRQGEYVEFVQDCLCDGPVEVWLQHVVDAMKAAGGSPIFTQVVGGTHDVWTEFYLKDEFYEWLLKFRR